MTDTDAAPTRQALAIPGRSGRLKVTGKLRTALDAMIWKASCRRDAAGEAGMSDHSLREALKKPHVKAYYLSGLQVLRDSERARNIRALTEVRDQTNNPMARVAAVKALEQPDEAAAAAANGSARLPGLTIVVMGAPQAPVEPPVVDVTPQLIEDELDAVPDFEPYEPSPHMASAPDPFAPPSPPRLRGPRRRI